MKQLCLSVLLFFGIFPTAVRGQNVDQEITQQNTPDQWEAVLLPQLPEMTNDNTFNISDFGATTSSTDNTTSIQAALNAVPSTGGMVVIPAGKFLTGPLTIKAKTILHLAKDATLQMLPYGIWPEGDRAFIVNDADDGGSDIIIEGEDKESSVIDGQGEPWWKAFEADETTVRPYAMIHLTGNSQRFLIRNIKLSNAPAYNIKFDTKGNTHGTVHDLLVRNPPSGNSETYTGTVHSHNTDGISISGRLVNIYDCDISTGDDDIVLKSNTRYIHVWNCMIGEGHGVSLGSQTGGINNVIVEDCTFKGTFGFKIKTARDRSGDVHDIIFRNSTLEVTRNPILMYCWYQQHNIWPHTATAEEVTATTPFIHDILIQNIVSKGTTNTSKSPIYGYPINIYGLPESAIKRVVFDNVQMEAKKDMLLAFCDVYFVNGCKINGKNPADAIQVQQDAVLHDDELPSEEEKPIVLSAATAKNEQDALTYTFEGGFTITNVKGKGYNAGKSSTIKYSTGNQYTIHIPDGQAVKQVTVKGYSNSDTADSYLLELNGETYSATDYVFPSRANNYQMNAFALQLEEPVTKSLTFSVGGAQTCLLIEMEMVNTTGITELRHYEMPPRHYYTLDGRRLETKPTMRNIYLVNGRKVVVR
jgi:hypothetical protein